jgi:hypothetical protein
VKRVAEKKICNLVIASRTIALAAQIGAEAAGGVHYDLPVLVPSCAIAKGEELCAFADPFHFVLPAVTKRKAFAGVKQIGKKAKR